MRGDGFRAMAGACALLGLAACAGDGPVDAGAPAVERVVVATSDARVWVGSDVDLAATVFDASGAQLAAPQLTWSSSNPAVVEVRRDANGEVRARGVAPGTATVRATADGVAGTVPLQVETGGEIRFRYSGPREGEFLAMGPEPADEATDVTQTWYVRMDDVLIFFGLQVHPDGSSDWFQMQLPSSSTWRDWGFPGSCIRVRCTEWVGVVFDETWNGRIENQKQYVGLFGTVEVTELRPTRIKVRFGGSFCEVHYPRPYLPSCDPAPDHPMLRMDGTVDMPL